MSVKTITITQVAYNTLKSLKHGDESFSQAILRIGSKKATAEDLFGILKGSKEETQEELKALKKMRQEMSSEIDKRVKRVFT